MTETTCCKPDCEKPRLALGMCSRHYAAHRRNDPSRPRCVVEGCVRGNYAKGVCQYHHSQTPGRIESHRQATLRWARANPDRIAEGTRRWIAANPDKARAQRRESMVRLRAKDPAAAAAAFKAWKTANPERWAELVRAGSAVRRARKRGTQIEPVDFAVVLAEHGMHCHICDQPISDSTVLHFDHVIPLSKGGTHTYDNIKPAHAKCNLRKAARLPIH